MKFRLFFALLALFIGAWTLFFKPFEVSEHQKGERAIVFENFLFDELTPKGKSVSIVGARGIAREGRLELHEILLRKEDMRLKAKEGVYADSKVTLYGGVDLNTSRFEVKTSKALYYLKAGIIHIDSAFEFLSPNLWARGKRAVVDLRRKSINAYKIEARVKI